MITINKHDINDLHLGLYTPGVGNTQFTNKHFLDRVQTILKRCGFEIESSINISTENEQCFWRIGDAAYVFKRAKWTAVAPGYSTDCLMTIDWMLLIYSDDLAIEWAVRMAMSNTIEQFWLNELLLEAAHSAGLKVSISYLRAHYLINQILKPIDFKLEIADLINQEFDRLLPEDNDTRAFQIEWDKITVFTSSMFTSSIGDRPMLELSPDLALVLLLELRTLESDLQLQNLDRWSGITSRPVSATIGFRFLGRL